MVRRTTVREIILQVLGLIRALVLGKNALFFIHNSQRFSLGGFGEGLRVSQGWHGKGVFGSIGWYQPFARF